MLLDYSRRWISTALQFCGNWMDGNPWRLPDHRNQPSAILGELSTVLLCALLAWILGSDSRESDDEGFAIHQELLPAMSRYPKNCNFVGSKYNTPPL